MQGGTPVRRKRGMSGQQTLHISFPEANFVSVLCGGKKRAGLQLHMDKVEPLF